MFFFTARWGEKVLSSQLRIVETRLAAASKKRAANSEQRFSMTHFFHIDDLTRQRAGKNKLYLEFLRVPAMSAGVYVLPKGGTDPQKPHREDEMYYVVRGRRSTSRLRSESEET